jgi:SAM-dependent methyltransferase
MNNLEEYADPLVYDWENKDFEPGGPFYLALARQLGNPVLEIACGTGRLTIPMARQGVDMTGLDVVPGMLDRAKHKAGNLPIRWVEADARNFYLGIKYRLIFMSPATLQHFLERGDQEAALACVRAHLAPDGRFALGVFFPHSRNMTTTETEQEWFTYTNEFGQEVHVTGTDHYDDIRQVHTETAYRRWHDATGKEILKIAPLSLRYFFPQELEALLHYNGFKVLERFGDWNRGPLTSQSQIMIDVCGLEPRS